jgi:hypothetical protein
MNRLRQLGIALAVVAWLCFILQQTAYASINAGTPNVEAHVYYIDPGTGSIIIQVLIGAFIAGVGMIGVYRVRVKSFLTDLFTRRRQDRKSEESK